jgi:hypothetical protein
MITAAFVRECKPRAKMYEVTCDALPGFILRVLPTGKKVALVRYRVDGKDRRIKIGLLGPALTIEEARRRAALVLGDVAAGESVVAAEPAGRGQTRSTETVGTGARPNRSTPRARRAVREDLRRRVLKARYRRTLAGHKSLVTTNKYMHLAPEGAVGAVELLERLRGSKDEATAQSPRCDRQGRAPGSPPSSARRAVHR